MKKLTLLLAAAMLSSMSFATTFEKVTAEPTDWSGEYLLVYENSATEAYVWTGVDAASNYTTATITAGAIEVADAVTTIKIAAMKGGYSVLVNGGTNNVGKYIYGTSGKNALNFGENPTLNTLTYATDHVVMTSGEIMAFNKTSGQTRFRYFKSGTISGNTNMYIYPQLYKKVAGAEVPATEIALDAATWNAEQYKYTQLTATLTPADATTEVVWTSSDENVATVVNGNVTAVGVGTANIIATAGVGVADTCAVTVTAPTILTCDSAKTLALSVSVDKEVVANGKFVVRGYVIKFVGDPSTDFSKFDNYSFWMADSKDATEGTFEAYQVAPKDGKTIVAVGDYVEVVGDLTKYGDTPETVGKGNATVAKLANPTTAIDNTTLRTPSVKTIENGQLVIIRDGVKYNAMGIQL